VAKATSDSTNLGVSMDLNVPRWPVVETLESRTLLAVAPHVIAIYPDNRGAVQIKFDADLDKTTVIADNVRLYTAGADKKLGTADDVLVARSLTYSTSQDLLTITPTTNLKANAKYRVRLLGNRIKGANGVLLDAEFNSTKTPSGNGTPGGNYDVTTLAASSQVVRFWTTGGYMNVKFYANTPLTNANFLKYANGGLWDVTFFHRSVPNFVVQGGGFKITPANGLDSIPTDLTNPALTNEPVNSNVRGTIAMARTDDGDPNTHDDENSATNQWFFNLDDNSGNLDNQNGGFTAFGKVTDSAGLAVMDKLGAYGRVNAGGVFSELPVRDVDKVLAAGAINPKNDLVRVTRVALLMTATATAISPTVAPAQTASTPSFCVMPLAPMVALSSATDELLASFQP